MVGLVHGKHAQRGQRQRVRVEQVHHRLRAAHEHLRRHLAAALVLGRARARQRLHVHARHVRRQQRQPLGRLLRQLHRRRHAQRLRRGLRRVHRVQHRQAKRARLAAAVFGLAEQVRARPAQRRAGRGRGGRRRAPHAQSSAGRARRAAAPAQPATHACSMYGSIHACGGDGFSQPWLRTPRTSSGLSGSSSHEPTTSDVGCSGTSASGPETTKSSTSVLSSVSWKRGAESSAGAATVTADTAPASASTEASLDDDIRAAYLLLCAMMWHSARAESADSRTCRRRQAGAAGAGGPPAPRARERVGAVASTTTRIL